MKSNHDTRFSAETTMEGGVIGLNSNLREDAHRSRHKLESISG